MRKRSLITCILILCVISIYGQAEESFIPTSPEAAALSKMVNYPINHNTGVPNINIPFHEISVGGLNLPIVLNYHAGGFKINEKATRVGLGWSLSSDIQITRSVNGKDDFSSGGYILDYRVKTGDQTYPLKDNYNDYFIAIGDLDVAPDKFNYKLLNKSGSFYFQKSSSGTSYTIVPIPYNNIKISWNDTDQVFTIIDTDGTIYKFGAPGSPPAYEWGAYSIDNLEDRKREYSGNTLTTWKCDKIISYNKKDIISFDYVQKKSVKYVSFNDKVEFFNNPSPCFPFPYGDPYDMKSPTDIEAFPPGMSTYNFNAHPLPLTPFVQVSSPKFIKYHSNVSKLHLPYFDQDGNLKFKIYNTDLISKSITTVYGLSVSKIKFRGGEVTFNGADRLSSIKIVDDKNNEIKSLHLYQNTKNTYRDGAHTEGTSYLDSLKVNNSAKAFKKYTLLYTSKFDYGNHLKGHDAWGYPNHNTQVITSFNNESLSIPITKILQERFYNPNYTSNGDCQYFRENVEINIGGNDNWAEVPNPSLSRASFNPSIQEGILKQIIYPTGGIVDFDFESNKYIDEFTSFDENGIKHVEKLPQISGGLRIRTINYLDKNSDLVNQKYYRYGDLEEGTGELIVKPKRVSGTDFSFAGETFTQEEVYYHNSNIVASEVKTTYQTSSSLNYTYPDGAPIYYTKVTEYLQDFGQKTGKTVYAYYPTNKFKPYDYQFYGAHLVEGTNIPYIKNNWMVGAQKSIEHYKFDNELGFKILNKKSFEYERYDLPNKLKVAYAFIKKNYHSLTGTSSQLNFYDIDFGQGIVSGQYSLPMGKLLLKKEIVENFNNSGKTTNITNYTYSNSFPTKPSHITTTNSTGEILQKINKYSYNFDGIYDQMEQANMIDQLVEEINIKTKWGIDTELSRKKIHYGYVNEGLGFYAPNSIETSVKGSSLQTELTYSKYDEFGNVLEILPKNGIPTSYIWGYNGLYPVAQLKNVYYDNISNSFLPDKNVVDDPINNPTNQAAILNVLSNLRNSYNNPNQLIDTYTYKRGVGVSSITDLNGYSLYYEYDKIGRLINKKDNDGNFLKTYKYNYANYQINNAPEYYNHPVMGTIIDPNCEPKISNNYVISGGSYRNYSSEYANKVVRDNLNNQTSLVPFHYTVDHNFNNIAAIELEYTYLFDTYPKKYPLNIEIDIIKDNSIIATQKLFANNLQEVLNGAYNKISHLILNEGTYQLSFRIDADVRYTSETGLIDFSITTMGTTNATQHLRSGDTFNFEKGKKYKITATSWKQ